MSKSVNRNAKKVFETQQNIKMFKNDYKDEKLLRDKNN